MTHTYLLVGCTALLACAGAPEVDTAPPAITVSSGGATVFSSSGGDARGGGCPSGALAPTYSFFADKPGQVYVRGSGRNAKLNVTATDPSGIQRIFIQIPDGTLRSPQVNQTVNVPNPDGSLARMYEYNYYGPEDTPVESQTIAIDLTHSDSNRIFNIFAIDVNGAQSDTQIVVIGEEEVICA